MWGIPTALLIKIGAGLAAFLIVFGVMTWVVDEIGDRREAKVRAEYAERDRLVAEKLAADERAARKREQSLHDTVAQSLQEKANAEADLAAARRRIDDLLRQRPARPATMPAATATASSRQGPAACTGAQLYRDDGEFLKRESERADQLRLALKQCYAQYDAARAAINAPANR